MVDHTDEPLFDKVPDPLDFDIDEDEDLFAGVTTDMESVELERLKAESALDEYGECRIWLV